MEAVRRAAGSDGFAIAFAATAIILSAALALPQPAFGGIAEDINAWLCGILRDTCNWIFAGQTSMLASIGADGVLSADFDQMLGGAGDVTMHDVVRGVWDAAILPIGCGMLSFVFTVQLIKVSQRMDGNASMPGVKEVVLMLVFFAVFLFLIQNSFDLMQAVYEVARLAIDRVVGLFGEGGEIDLAEVSIATTEDDVAALLAMLVVALVSWLVVIVAYVVALVVSWARAIQIYVMAAFSPIPLALVSLDETRQMGVGYLRNFAAVCLAGVIILVLLVSFPIVLGGLNAASAGAPVVDTVVGGLSYALQYLAMCVLLILSLVKSGSWARDILGG
ncbi:MULTISPECIES: conjugal transfer protein TrbL [Gordonibacter]|uniref:Conjugal transfer protein TrbL n=1 Tax=Gordonibacter faecis TaxID=3047475 RepID=A0ABT7DK08_9ACTN|nr:conjugal transfer protein TrbL [Gordonibacter sp. KGMB12511]MDJ1649857.1 conjugal transfer protein TrbL [Gordonibacter sp. KGMB12511]